MSLKFAVIQLNEKQLDYLMEYQETKSSDTAVKLVDSIIDDLGISENK